MKYFFFILCINFTMICFCQKKSDKAKMGSLDDKIGTIGENFYFLTTQIDVFEKKNTGIVVYDSKKFKKFIIVNEIEKSLNKYEAIKSIILNGDIYVFLGKSKNNISTYKIIKLDSNLNLLNNDFINFDFQISNFRDVSVKKDSNIVAVFTNVIIKEKKDNLMQSFCIDLQSLETKKSQIIFKPRNNLLLSDAVVNQNLILNTAYFSHSSKRNNDQKNGFKSIEHTESIFFKFDGERTHQYEYKNSSNPSYLTTNFKFFKIDENEYYIASQAFPTKDLKFGYFISKNLFASDIKFENHEILINSNYTNPKFWNKRDLKRIKKGKSPNNIYLQNLEEFLIKDGKIFFFCLEYNPNIILNKQGNNGEFSTDINSTNSQNDALNHNVSYSGNSTCTDYDIEISIFNLNNKECFDFYKTRKRASETSIAYGLDKKRLIYYMDTSQICFYFNIMIYSNEFTKSKKGFGLIGQGRSAKIQYFYSEKKVKARASGKPIRIAQCHIENKELVLFVQKKLVARIDEFSIKRIKF